MSNDSEIVTLPPPSVHFTMDSFHQWLPITEHVYVLGNLEHHLPPLRHVCQISEIQKGTKVLLPYPLKESRAKPDPQLLFTKINCPRVDFAGIWLRRSQGVISGLPAFNPGEWHLEKQAVDRGKKAWSFTDDFELWSPEQAFVFSWPSSLPCPPGSTCLCTMWGALSGFLPTFGPTLLAPQAE